MTSIDRWFDRGFNGEIKQFVRQHLDAEASIRSVFHMREVQLTVLVAGKKVSATGTFSTFRTTGKEAFDVLLKRCHAKAQTRSG